ncbi:hypothetical protein LIPSTDRAFT_69602 [Lipomyces starkeyi NRRL Y-11557]|uniref:Uncharacterized protein n=1 Tax=Lipomyces starkeyi NRRL Y-11557 TaxID=675824 RepID=A0A1E3Q8N4_LIPST|nr:hypothetical protein LIPSTDRAFT_70409 [Lipomyces starkeyi NRRL Y-11557]ODQ74059.1 hypothetical protein LIPSTDRAFT_69602 [Lipomyces starkeyi NRRL Y-11557]
MPRVDSKFYCPLRCSSGRHQHARYTPGLGLEVPSTTYYRHRTQRRIMGSASQLTAD